MKCNESFSRTCTEPILLMIYSKKVTTPFGEERNVNKWLNHFQRRAKLLVKYNKATVRILNAAILPGQESPRQGSNRGTLIRYSPQVLCWPIYLRLFFFLSHNHIRYLLFFGMEHNDVWNTWTRWWRGKGKIVPRIHRFENILVWKHKANEWMASLTLMLFTAKWL